jgi:hypothetical protein
MVTLEPEQPAAVVAAVQALVAARRSDTADPWWQAGLDEALGTSSLTTA